MSDNLPLRSAVFVLRYDRAFRSDKYMGRAAQAIALHLLSEVDPALSAEMHNHNGYLPMTVSDLFQSDSHHHWLRLTTLRPDLDAALCRLAEREHLTYDGWTVAQTLLTHHDWCRAETLPDLVRDQWRPPRQLTLEFASPTTFKSGGLYRPLPDPPLVFKSLYERWQKLAGADLPLLPGREALEAFTRDFVTISDYRLQFVDVPLKRGSLPAFRGRVTYRCERHNPDAEKRDPDQYAALIAQRDSYLSLLNLLAHFGFYAGAGNKTAQGMGMLRPV